MTTWATARAMTLKPHGSSPTPPRAPGATAAPRHTTSGHRGRPSHRANGRLFRYCLEHMQAQVLRELGLDSADLSDGVVRVVVARAAVRRALKMLGHLCAGGSESLHPLTPICVTSLPEGRIRWYMNKQPCFDPKPYQRQDEDFPQEQIMEGHAE